MIKTIIPSSQLLAKYIECFYIYEGEHATTLNYMAFPHVNTGLSFFRDVSVTRSHSRIEISESKHQGVHVEILGKYTFPLWIAYTGKVQEISIIFKPIGINRFIRNDYFSIAPVFSQLFTNSIWNEFAVSLFSGQDDIKLLESFLLSQLTEKLEFNLMEEALAIVENQQDESTVSIIANKLGYNLKTFQRHFKKHMGCSPVEYRRICRFRYALRNKLNGTEFKNLTEITYEGGYADQSHFIKEFRKLTHHNPKEFFNLVSQVDGDKIIWEIK